MSSRRGLSWSLGGSLRRIENRSTKALHRHTLFSLVAIPTSDSPIDKAQILCADVFSLRTMGPATLNNG